MSEKISQDLGIVAVDPVDPRKVEVAVIKRNEAVSPMVQAYKEGNLNGIEGLKQGKAVQVIIVPKDEE